MVLAAALPAHAEQPASPRLVGKEVFWPRPRDGARLVAVAFYTRASGLELACDAMEEIESDKSNRAWRRYSSDNGRTWSEPQPVESFRRTDQGTIRRSDLPGFVDPENGVLITLINHGVLPTDNPLEGMKHWTLRYAISRDGGRTTAFEGPIVVKGEPFSPQHPMPGVWLGKNAAMIGDSTCVPIRLRSGDILVPIQITPVGPDGQYYNPGGGYTYHDAFVLIGRWNARGRLDWELSEGVRGDPARSTRGLIEPTLAELPDGRVLMVMRGSNDSKPDLRGYRWYSLSSDDGRTWSKAEPWRFAGGEPFFSPSSCSQLIRHSSGRLYWIGNLCDKNPRGNGPRYPLVIGEVDQTSALLKRDTLCVIEDRRPGEPEWFAASNFYAREDRETHEILIHCTPLGKDILPTATQPTRRFEWTADAYLYRVRVQ